MKIQELAVTFDFVTQLDVRRVISRYHGEAIRAFDAGLFAATVFLSGAALEGCLTWALEKRRGSLPPEYTKWGLAKLLDEAAKDKILGDTARAAAWAVRDFRNLIHPYNAINKSTRTDLALATGALAAVVEVTRSLQGRLGITKRTELTVPPFDASQTPQLLNFAWLLPGQLAGAAGPRSHRDLEMLSDLGVQSMVRLAPAEEAFVTVADIQAAGFTDLYEPVKDFTAPSLDQISRIIAFIRAELETNHTILVCCGAGYGRTSTILCAWLIANNVSVEEALRQVKDTCYRSPETAEQVEVLRQLEGTITR